MKAYCIGGPMDMQVLAVRDEERWLRFATTPLMPIPEGPFPPPLGECEITYTHYRMVYRSHDGRRAVYVAEDAL